MSTGAACQLFALVALSAKGNPGSLALRAVSINVKRRQSQQLRTTGAARQSALGTDSALTSCRAVAEQYQLMTGLEPEFSLRTRREAQSGKP